MAADNVCEQLDGDFRGFVETVVVVQRDETRVHVPGMIAGVFVCLDGLGRIVVFAENIVAIRCAGTVITINKTRIADVPMVRPKRIADSIVCLASS